MLKNLQDIHENNIEEYKIKIHTLNNLLDAQKFSEKEKKKSKKVQEDGKKNNNFYQ